MGKKRTTKAVTSETVSSSSRKAPRTVAGGRPSRQPRSTFRPNSWPPRRHPPRKGRGYDPNHELFENLNVSGCEIKVCKGGLRRARHLYIVDKIKASDACVKAVCNVQQMLIRKGFYMQDYSDPSWQEIRKARYADEELKCAQRDSKLHPS